MPPRLGLYSLANTPEELLSRGYGLVGTEFAQDPAFGNLTYNTSYNPAPYTGAIPFQNVFRISEGVSNNFDNPSYGGSSNPRFNQFEPEEVATDIMEKSQPFEFLSSAYEDKDEDAEQVDYLPGQEPSGIAQLVDYLPFGEKSLAGALLRNFLPQESPEIKNIKNFYRQNYGLDSIGRVDSGIMKGYNPVSGSDFLNKITGGILPARSFGLADAAQRRISNILGRKIAQTDISRARVKKLKELRDREIRDRADFGESLSSIGKSTFTGKGQAFEKQSGGVSGKGTANERNYGGR